MKQFLEILWIWYWLSKEEIKKAYHKKSMQFHPDRENWDEYKMILLNNAYKYIIENYNDYLNKVEDNKITYISIYNEWLYICYVLENYLLALEKIEKSLEMKSDYKEAIFLQTYCLYKLWRLKEAYKIITKLYMSNSKNILYYRLFESISIWLWDLKVLEKLEEYRKKNNKTFTNNKKYNWDDYYSTYWYSMKEITTEKLKWIKENKEKSLDKNDNIFKYLIVITFIIIVIWGCLYWWLYLLNIIKWLL